MSQEPTISLSLKDYEDLKQFKDNFHKKSCVRISNSGKSIIEYYFYSDDEMNERLMGEVSKLQDENTNLKNDVASSRADSFNWHTKLYNREREILALNEEIKELKKSNVFGFLKWKNN